MAQSARLVRSDGNLAVGVLGAAVLVGLGVAAVTYARDRSAHRHAGAGAKGAALAAYLREHLTALRRRDRGRRAAAPDACRHPGRPPVRVAVRRVPRRARRRPAPARADRRSPLSLKRLAGQANGSAPMPANGGDRGDLSLFRTLESLAIGVQAQALHVAGARIAAGRSADSEPAQPWRARGDGRPTMGGIEERRRSLVGATFPALQLSAMDVPID